MTAEKQKSRPLACVIGPIEVVRALGLAGVRCAVVVGTSSPTRHSRYAVRVLPWVDPWSHPEEFVARLIDFGNEQTQKPVLYYSADGDLMAVSRFREQLSDVFRFVIADSGLVEDLVNKARFQALAERLDLPVPRGQALYPAAGATPDEVDLRFPLILKQLTRNDKTWRAIARGKALAIDSPKALRELWPVLVESGVDVLLQEIVEGPESQVESYHAYVDEGGQIAGEFTGKKIRTYPSEFGYSTALVITDDAEVAALGRTLLERLNIRGVSKFDFKRGLDGSLYLLEINPRFNLWHHPAARAGVNLPALIYSDLVGLPRDAVRPPRPGARWCSLRHDAQAARAEGIGFVRWFRWMLGVEVKSPFAWNDPLPFALGGLGKGRLPWRTRKDT